MKISMIAAIWEDNRVIWKWWDMPWWHSLKEDLQYFKEKTNWKTIVMWRKTFESLWSIPLKNRINIVITKKELINVLTYSSLEECLQDQSNQLNENDELMIIWWATLYQQCIDIADTLYLTLVKQHFDWDTFFPEFENKFSKVSSRISENWNLEFAEFKKL